MYDILQQQARRMNTRFVFYSSLILNLHVSYTVLPTYMANLMQQLIHNQSHNIRHNKSYFRSTETPCLFVVGIQLETGQRFVTNFSVTAG